MTYSVVTSFGPGGWDLYARRMVTTFLEHWKDVTLTVYFHDCEQPTDIPPDPRLGWRSLHSVPGFDEFRAKAPRGGDPYNFRLDAWKFSAKVFALWDASRKASYRKNPGRMIWLDADTFTTKTITPSWLNELCPDHEDVVCLQRSAINYSETSFMLFDLRRSPADTLLQDIYSIYVKGELFNYQEWHDGFVFERLFFLHRLHGMSLLSLTPRGYDGLEAFMASPLGERMTHLKGNRKMKFANRYDRLDALVNFYAQTREEFDILETGTWNGQRAIRLANAAFLAGVKEVHYHGYDLFEGATSDTDKEELNTKKHFSQSEVEKLLAAYGEEVLKQGRKFSFSLHKGDTKDTLRPIKVDFAYLDGGHSERTAYHDYSCVKSPDTVVVFDDFFIKDELGRIPAWEHCGTNVVYDAVLSGHKYVIPSTDPVLGGGYTCLALVLPEDFAKPPMEILGQPATGPRPLKIQARDCVPQEHIQDNVASALGKIKRWVRKIRTHDGTMVVASGGPSLEKNLKDIRKRQMDGAFVMCVKHALPVLLKGGIIPDGLILLDPRDVAGKSTHGKPRTELLAKIPKSTACFVASMSDPSVVDLVLSKTDNVFGWHAYTDSLKDFKGFPDNAFMISGGTCAAWRAVALGKVLGFAEFHLYGFDFAYYGDVDMNARDESGRPKYLKVGIGRDKTKFVSTGELVAAAQDAEHFFSSADTMDMRLYCHGDGIGPLLWKEILGSTDQNRPTLKEFLA